MNLNLDSSYLVHFVFYSFVSMSRKEEKKRLIIIDVVYILIFCTIKVKKQKTNFAFFVKKLLVREVVIRIK